MKPGDPILEYVSPNVPGSRFRATSLTASLICTALTLAAFTITLRVEWVNARAGFALPTDERLRSSPASEAFWRAMNSSRDPSLESRVLTTTETSELKEFLAKESAHNELRDMVDGICFFQSLLVPLLLLWIVVQIVRRPIGKRALIAWASLALMVVSGALMIYRGYFFRMD